MIAADMARLERMLAEHEGRRRVPYLCPSGKWTVGVGRNLENNQLTLTELLACLADGIPEQAIDTLLRNDVASCLHDLGALFPSFSGWPPARQAALVDMRFALGLRGLLGFRRMLGHLRDGAWGSAADEALDSAWARQVGRRAQRIAQMIRSGEWPA